MTRDVNGMEKLVEELQYQVPLKDATEPGDLVIMLRENDDGRISMVYARVMGFDRDLSKRDEWWHVRFVFLEVPPLPQTIILQTPHFTGREIFTMGGRKVFIKAVNFEVFSEGKTPEPARDDGGEKTEPPAKPGRPAFTLVKPE
jgi:hypothetical protein